MKKFTQLSMLLAFSVVLNLIETFIPFFNGIIPGLKLGLANTIVIFVLYLYSPKDALKISLLRVVLVGILRSTGISFIFSLFGALLSVISMIVMKKYTKLSIIGVSIVGSVMHSLGQIISAAILINNTKVMIFFPWLILFSIPTGIAIGLVSKECVKYYEKRLNY